MWRILKKHRVDPAPQRTSVTWTQFLRSQAAVACDFATVDTVLLRRCYLLFFIDITTREVLYVIWNQRQLEHLVVDYIDHYNTHRPHRSLDQRPPVATDPPDQPDRHLQVVKTARCDGLINEYRNAA